MTGEYVAFVDSDDRVSPNYVEYLHGLLRAYDADIASCNYLPVKEGGVVIKSKDSLVEDILYDKTRFKDMFSVMLYEENTSSYDSVWTKLYKKYLFDDIRFPKGKLFEDIRTVPQLLQKSEKIIFGSEKHYFYHIRKNSIVTRKFSEDNHDFITATEEMCRFIATHHAGLESACARRYTFALIRVLRQMTESESYDTQEACSLRKEILKNGKRIVCDDKAPPRDKFAILALLFGVKSFSACWQLYAKLTRRK
jgi:hypothetical protein